MSAPWEVGPLLDDPKTGSWNLKASSLTRLTVTGGPMCGCQVEYRYMVSPVWPGLPHNMVAVSQRLGSLLKDKEKERMPEALLASVTRPQKPHSDDFTAFCRQTPLQRHTDPSSVGVSVWHCETSVWNGIRSGVAVFGSAVCHSMCPPCTQFRPWQDFSKINSFNLP